MQDFVFAKLETYCSQSVNLYFTSSVLSFFILLFLFLYYVAYMFYFVYFFCDTNDWSILFTIDDI